MNTTNNDKIASARREVEAAERSLQRARENLGRIHGPPPWLIERVSSEYFPGTVYVRRDGCGIILGIRENNGKMAHSVPDAAAARRIAAALIAQAEYEESL